MASLSEDEPKKLLILTTFAYRKPGMDLEEYHKHISEVHVPLSSEIMQKYGVVKRLIAHNWKVPRDVATVVADPYKVDEMWDFDAVITTVVSDVEKFARMKKEAYWKEKVITDWPNFTDTKRTRVTVGWLEERIRDGELLDGDQKR